jgi:broad specificity phosphatase PhoE
MRHQELLVLRHGQRLDEVQDTWSASAERPWDPPLATHGLAQVLQESVLTALALREFPQQASALQLAAILLSCLCTTFCLFPCTIKVECDGAEQASAAAALLQGRGVVQIVTSPFQRCLQTAAELARALRLSPSAIEVDWSVCEV